MHPRTRKEDKPMAKRQAPEWPQARKWRGKPRTTCVMAGRRQSQSRWPGSPWRKPRAGRSSKPANSNGAAPPWALARIGWGPIPSDP